MSKSSHDLIRRELQRANLAKTTERKIAHEEAILAECGVEP